MASLGHFRSKIRRSWRNYWVPRSGSGYRGRLASYLSALGTPPLHGRAFLSQYGTRGYISYHAKVSHEKFEMGPGGYLGDGVFVYADPGDGEVIIKENAQLYGNTLIRTAQGGSVIIGEQTHIQLGCTLSACLGSIKIGKKVEIAANCSFYAFNHGFEAQTPIMDQPLHSKGPIIIEDEAWLGDGVKVLDGVRIGKGAVIGAGAVVTSNIPDYSIAAGIPARVIAQRK